MSLKNRWALELHPNVELEEGTAKSALPRLHPTHARLRHGAEGTSFAWESRDHRKHRHLPEKSGKSRKPGSVLKGVLNLVTRIEYWNISWWIAFLYTLGSIVWVINGFGSFLPFGDSGHFEKADNEAGWTAFLGATIFEFASLLLPWEAWNRPNAALFGWNVTHLMDSRSSASDIENGQPDSEKRSPKQKWVWWSTDPKYWHELGFLAGIAQLFAASVFWISGFTAIPQIQDSIMENTPLLNGVFWTPQVIGGTGFIVSGLLYLLETQKKWYLPAPLSLGWQIAFWNTIGGIGFMLCGALGYDINNHKVAYQSALCTFWGGWAFLIGSVMQLYESVNAVG